MSSLRLEYVWIDNDYQLRSPKNVNFFCVVLVYVYALVQILYY